MGWDGEKRRKQQTEGAKISFNILRSRQGRSYITFQVTGFTGSREKDVWTCDQLLENFTPFSPVYPRSPPRVWFPHRQPMGRCFSCLMITLSPFSDQAIGQTCPESPPPNGRREVGGPWTRQARVWAESITYVCGLWELREMGRGKLEWVLARPWEYRDRLS